MSIIEPPADGSSVFRPSNSCRDDEDFLFCTLAIKLQFLTPEQLRKVVMAWTDDVDLSIVEYCQDHGMLDVEECSVLSKAAKRLILKNQSAEHLTEALAADALNALLLAANNKPNFDLGGFLGGESPEKRVHKLKASDRFEIQESLAKGGLGEVFVARDKELNRDVAIKKIQSWHADNFESNDRFVLEAEVTGRLEHPGIVPVYGMGHDAQDRPYYAMRLIDGCSLKEELQNYHAEAPSLEPSAQTVRFRQLLSRFVDVCQAIAYAHSRSVLHRDIKPSNIILGKFGETLVVDWGLAKVLDGKEEPTSTEEPFVPSSGSSYSATVVGRVVGTPAYMSPEQAAGNTILDERADVYGLGATLYTLLTGAPPFENSREMLKRVQNGEFESPLVRNPDLSKPLSAICEKAMSTLAKDRYDSVCELSHDIELWLADEPVSAYAEDATDRISRFYRQNRRTCHLAAGCLMLFTVASSGSAIMFAGKNSQLKQSSQTIEQQSQRVIANYEKGRNLAFDLMALSRDILSTVPNVLHEERKLAIKANEAMKFFYEQDPTNADIQISYAATLVNLSIRNRKRGKFEKSEQQFRESIALLDSAGAARPNDPKITLKRATSILQLGYLQTVMGRLKASKKSYDKARALCETLVDDYPTNDKYRRLLGDVYLQLSAHWWDLELDSLSVEQANQAERIFQQLVNSGNGTLDDTKGLLRCLKIPYLAAKANENKEQALSIAEKGFRIATDFRNSHPSNHRTDIWLQAGASFIEARLEIDRNDESALKDLRISETESRELVNGFPKIYYYRLNLTECLLLKAKYGGTEEAKRSVDETIDMIRNLDNWAELIHYKTQLVRAYALSASLQEIASQADAVESLERAVQLQSEIVESAPQEVRQASMLRQLKRRLQEARSESDHSTTSGSTSLGGGSSMVSSKGSPPKPVSISLYSNVSTKKSTLREPVSRRAGWLLLLKKNIDEAPSFSVCPIMPSGEVSPGA